MDLKFQVKLWPSASRRVCDDEMVAAILHNSRTIPPRLDWREQGFLTRPENQRDCGSCYAYSIAGSIAGQIFKQTGRLISLSEQQIVDCSVSTGNLGCNGGSLRNTLQYLERAGGLMLSSSYPYRSQVIIVVSFSDWLWIFNFQKTINTFLIKNMLKVLHLLLHAYNTQFKQINFRTF